MTWWGKVAAFGGRVWRCQPNALPTRHMNRNNCSVYLIGALAVLLWCLPFARAVRFYLESCEYLRETGSSEAGGDVDFGLDLLYSYSYSLGSALAIAWCFSARPRIAFVLPIFAVLFAAYEVLRVRPEEPIVLFPAMHPYRPAIISIVALLGALAIRFLPRRAT